MKKIETALGWDNNQDRINQLKEMRAAEVSKLNARGFEDMDDAFSNEDQAELMEENAERAAEGEVLSENLEKIDMAIAWAEACLLYTSPSPRDRTRTRMPSSA